jgi:cation-transporting ATPase I
MRTSFPSPQEVVERLARLHPLAPRGRTARHVWVGNGRAHIEVRALDRAGATIGAALPAALERLRGVHWAEVSEAVGRVIVAFDGKEVDPEELVDAVEAFEDLHGVGDVQFPAGRPEHPGDPGPIHRHATALVSDLVGIGIGTAGRFLRLPKIPGELAAVLPFVDAQPRLRQLVARVAGAPAADLGLALASAAAQAMAQGPLGLVVDAAHRANQLREVEARRQVWERREPELSSHRSTTPAASQGAGAQGGGSDDGPPTPRPVPLPAGPIETSADLTGLASLGAFGATLALTGDLRRAAAVGLAGTPKSARLGRDAFAARAHAALAARGLVAMDAQSLRLLDRVDTVVVEASCLLTGRMVIDRVEPVDPDPAAGHPARPPVPPDALEAKAYRLFDPAMLGSAPPGAPPRVSSAVPGPASARRSGNWSLRRLGESAGPMPGGAADMLGLFHRGHLAARVGVAAELDPLAGALVEAIRHAGLDFVVAGRAGSAGARLGADAVVAGGEGMGRAVQALQREGKVVALIAHRGGGALAAADCGVGLLRPGHRPPWRADLLCGPGLAAAELLVSAIGPARAVSRRSVALAAAGSVTAAGLAFAGDRRRAAERAGLAVNGAALASVISGAWSGFQLAHRPLPVPDGSLPWHLLPADRALQALGSSPEGLSPAEAGRRRRAWSQRSEPAGWESLLSAVGEELANPLTPILGVGAGLSAATGSPVDAALVGAVVAGSAVASALYRLRASAALERLGRAGIVPATVRRGGALGDEPADRLVPGDIVVLQSGDIVPADLRILEAWSLEADESSLTGESMPVRKQADPCPAASVADRSCMLYEGTTIANGRAVGLVVAVGLATEVGRSLGLAGVPPRAGVEARLGSLTRIAVPVSVAGGAALIGSGLLHGRSPREALGSGVALAVAAVPEGLPFVAQAASMAAARRLSGRGALVRNARTIEALGRVDVLCFDKTGTLTEGRLRLQLVSDGRSEQPLTALTARHRDVLAAATRASPEPADEPLAHATDQAVLDAAADSGVCPATGLRGWRREGELPFDPTRGYHLVLGTAAGQPVVSVKGAPEVVLGACARWRMPGGAVAVDAALQRRLGARVRALARRGFRVLAVAERSSPAPAGGGAATPVEAVGGSESLADLDFLGLLAFADQVRPSAAGAVGELRRAGVAVAMITGDHPVTARAIAGELTILDGGGPGRVVTGPELDSLDDGQLDALLPGVSVFARVTPAHKLRIVGSYQRRGHRVAMTGDGSNDAPAIRRADVGIALGRRATTAARESADLVVTDDRVETIVEAIIEGRAMWASLRDALAILIGGNLGEIGFTLAASSLSGRSPLTPRQLLLVNLLTDLGPALAIAIQPPRAVTAEQLAVEGPDTSLGRPLLGQIGLRAAATTAGATGGWLGARCTGRRARASTVALAALVGTQLGQTVVAGSHSPLVVGTALASAAALVAVVQTPGISQFFGCTPLGPVGWATAAGAAGLATSFSVGLPAAARAISGLAAEPGRDG